MKKIKLLIIPLMVLVLTGCKSETKKCIKGHTQAYMMSIYNGKGVTLIPMTTYICDEYEEVTDE